MVSSRIARIFYNLVSPVYDYFFGSNTRYVREMRKRIVGRLDLKKGYHVLEVGVGTGANLPHIHERTGKRGKIFGVDISEGMLDKCRKNIQKWGFKVEIIFGEAEKLPYPDNSFDAVLGFGAINFLSDKRKAVLEMIRVAKPGARIVMGDEHFPIIGTPESALKLLPKNVSDVRQGIEKVIIPFWIIDFKKRGRK